MRDLIVIGYDGSAEAKRAIALAPRLLCADRAVVVSVWHDGGLIAAAAPLALSPPIAALEAELAGVAQALADEGALRAALAGLDVTAATRHAPGRAAIGHALLDAADEYDADLVVVGRGAGSLLGDAVFGSISSGAVRDGRRPVLVVPA
jgi:nucleotide-binding universal stress UspA family protein